MTLRRAIARLEIFDKLPYAGGVRLAFASKVISAVSKYSLEGDESLRFSIPRSSRAASVISDLRIARVWRADDDFTNWLIAPQETVRSRGGILTVTCWPVSYLLSLGSKVPEWQITDPKGTPILDVTVTGTIEEILQTYIIDNTRINGEMTWLDLGTIEPTTEITASWSNASRRAVINACLDGLAAKGEVAEFRLRETSSGAFIDILSQVGSSAPLLNLRLPRNLQSLTRTVDPTDRWTRMQPELGTVGGEPTFLGYSRWLVTANPGGVLTLADPAGGAPPVGFDDQLNSIGAYYVYREKTAKVYAITDSTASPNTVTITGDPGIAVGEFVQFRTTATAGTPIPIGPGGPVSSASRGYILPLLATGKAGNNLTLTHIISYVEQPTADDQYVGDDVAFSNFVQTASGSGVGTWPTFTMTLSSGTTAGLAVGDWCISGDLSVWEGGGGLGISIPPLTVTGIIDATTLTVEVRGAGPDTFPAGFGTSSFQFFRPVAGNLTGTVTDSVASTHTLTVDDATGLTATTSAPCALELSYTPSSGEVPYYLDHPDYASDTPPGIGIKYGTIDRSNLAAVANLSPNALARNATAGVADGYSIVGAGSMVLNTDPLYTQLGGQSILVTLSATNSQFRTPTFNWRPAYAGQRFSVRAHLLFPENWSGNRELDMRLGIVKADGTTKLWRTPDRSVRMFPPDAAGTLPADSTKPVGGAFFDAVLNGFDITTATNLGDFGSVGQADLVDAVGYFVAFVNVTNAPPFYFDGISITATDVPPDTIEEFGKANEAWQDTNTALGILAPPQESVAVSLVDLARLNPALRATDLVTLGGTALVNNLELALVNQRWRIVEIPVQDELNQAKTEIVLAARTKRLTDLFLRRVSAISSTSTSATTGLQSSGNGTTTVGGTTGTGETGGTGGTGDTILPSGTLGVTLDSSNVPTATYVGNASVVRVKFAGRTDRFPTADEVRAEASVSSEPFTASYTALAAGETEYVSALAYDAAGNESALAQASATAAVASSAPDSADLVLWYRMDQQLYQNTLKTISATADGDFVRVIGDLSGNGNDAVSPGSPGVTGHTTADATLRLSSVNGEPALDFDGSTGLQHYDLPDCVSSLTEGECFVVFRDRADPPPGGARIGPVMHFGAGTINFVIGFGATNATFLPYTDGVCYDDFGTANSLYTVGNLTEDLSSAYRIYDVYSKTNDWQCFLNGVSKHTETTNTVGFTTTPQLGCAANTGFVFDGRIAEVLFYSQKRTTSQRNDVLLYLSSRYGIASTGLTASPPSLTFVRSGGDVIVTATAPLASSVKIAASLTGTPSDADVRASTALTTAPFRATFAAPTGTDVLHVAAFAYYDVIGGTESTKATLDIPVETPTPTGDVEFVVAASDSSVPSARVVTDTATIAKDVATAGQIKLSVVDGSLGVVKLSATGTPSASTFLRGDNTWATPSGGSGGSRTTTTLTTASLANGAVQTGTIALAKAGLILQVTVDRGAWVRLYQTSADVTADSSRTLGTAAATTTDILAEWSFSASGTRRRLVVPYCNGDGSPTTSIYYSITNRSGSTSTVQVDFLHIPLET